MTFRTSWLRDLATRVTGTIRRRTVEQRLAEEIRFHVEMQMEKNVRLGMTPDDARREAMVSFGGNEQWKEAARDEYRSRPVENFLQDIRYAGRSLRSAPAFSITAVLALALGIGSAAAVFSLLEGVVLRPLPYADPGRLVMMWETNKDKGLDHEPLSPVNFVDYRAMTDVFADAAAWWRPQLNLSDDERGDPIRVPAVEVTGNLFSVLGVRPMLGHGFTTDTTLRGKEPQAVISHRLWQSRFGGSATIVGKAIRLNGKLNVIAGVMPPGFGFPGETDVWQGLEWNLTQHSRGAHFMESVARMRPAVSADRANRSLAALGGRLAKDFRATNGGWSVRAVELDREVAGAFRPALFALTAAAGLLLVIACINVANLMLARATARSREVAVRAAIGASRRRLMALFLTESLALATIGAVIGIAFAVLSVKALVSWSPVQIPRAAEVGVNGTVLLFAIALTAATALAFGLAPALLFSRTELQDVLKDGARGSGLRGRGSRGALVVAEVALAVVLLSGAGLLIRSVSHLLQERAGVDASAVQTANVQLPDAAYKDWNRVEEFYTALLQSLRQRPEVAGAGATDFLPLETGWRMPYTISGAAPVPKGDEPMAQIHSVDEGYFGALRVPLVRGRTFGDRDNASSPPVVIINEALARQMWPGQNPIGRRIVTTTRFIGPLGKRLVAGDEHEIIGVARDVKNTSLRNAAEPAMYFAERQFPFRKMFVVVRGRGDPSRLTSVISDEVRRLDPTLSIADVRSMERVLAASVDPPRFVMLLLSVFATLALTLAAVGIYGILTYLVSQRGREIGIRLALGGEPRDMLRMIVREGLGLALAGCAIGAAGAYVAGRSLSCFLYGVSPGDPVTIGGVMLVVMLVAVAACVIPGRRASTQDPVAALRGD